VIGDGSESNERHGDGSMNDGETLTGCHEMTSTGGNRIISRHQRPLVRQNCSSLELKLSHSHAQERNLFIIIIVIIIIIITYFFFILQYNLEYQFSSSMDIRNKKASTCFSIKGSPTFAGASV